MAGPPAHAGGSAIPPSVARGDNCHDSLSGRVQDDSDTLSAAVNGDGPFDGAECGLLPARVCFDKNSATHDSHDRANTTAFLVFPCALEVAAEDAACNHKTP